MSKPADTPPRFSIVVPCHNAVGTIAETVASIRRQTLGDWEAICIDDGSTDATWAMLCALAAEDDRIRPVRTDGKGPSAARNLGALTHARGEILAFCDADDVWAETKLDRLATAFADPSVAAAYGRVAFFRDRVDAVTALSTLPEGDLQVETLLGENPVCTMSNVAVRRADYVRTGGLDERLVHAEDLEWLIRLVAGGARMVGLEEVLVWYRTSSGGLSSDLLAMETGRRGAIATAARFGYAPGPRAEAIHLRYLARRALRLDTGDFAALRLAARGLATSPAGFLSDPRRGVLTAVAALGAAMLPRRLSRALFAR